MSARYQIFHDTHYHYDSPVSLAQQLAHLWPRPCAWQRCSDQQLDISPQPSSRRDELDVFGNPITRLAFERPHDELLVNAGLTVEVLARPKFDPHVSREDRREFIRLLGGVMQVVPIIRRVAACRDPRDDKFLDVALAGEAAAIISGDKDLLVLNPWHGIPILTPADYLTIHRAPGTPAAP